MENRLTDNKLYMTEEEVTKKLQLEHKDFKPIRSILSRDIPFINKSFISAVQEFVYFLSTNYDNEDLVLYYDGLIFCTTDTDIYKALRRHHGEDFIPVKIAKTLDDIQGWFNE